MDDVGPFPAFPAHEVQCCQPRILWIWVFVWALARGIAIKRSRKIGRLLPGLSIFISSFSRGIWVCHAPVERDRKNLLTDLLRINCISGAAGKRRRTGLRRDYRCGLTSEGHQRNTDGFKPAPCLLPHKVRKYIAHRYLSTQPLDLSSMLKVRFRRKHIRNCAEGATLSGNAVVSIVEANQLSRSRHLVQILHIRKDRSIQALDLRIA
jgi:hypothetical protein